MPDRALILLVEDNDDDALLIRRAFKRAGVLNPVYVVRDGDAAIAYLSGDCEYSNRTEYPLPKLILLDLNLPGIDGFDVLAWIRHQPGMSWIPVVILTASDGVYRMNRAYALGANSFLVKPADFENVVGLTKVIAQFWLQANKAPQASRPAQQPESSTI